MSSGCRLDASGNIPCDPEAMRAAAEKKLGKPISLAQYTLARNMTSEIGSGSVEEMVAVGEAAVNQGHGNPVPVLLYRTKGSTGYGRFGEIQSGTSGRWASTSQDPTVLSLALAELILSGGSGNFNRGANDQAGLQYVTYFKDPVATIRRKAESGDYWVGPLPGVDAWKTTQFKHVGVKPNSPVGAALLAVGVSYFGARKQVGSRWVSTIPDEVPDCVGSETTVTPGGLLTLFAIGALGLGLGLVATRRLLALPTPA